MGRTAACLQGAFRVESNLSPVPTSLGLPSCVAGAESWGNVCGTSRYPGDNLNMCHGCWVLLLPPELQSGPNELVLRRPERVGRTAAGSFKFQGCQVITEKDRWP